MMNFIKPEYLISLYLILNKQEEVSLKDLGNYGEKLNKELKEQMIEALFLYSDKYIDEMLSDYKDYFEYNGLYEDMFPVDVIIPDIDDEQFDPETSIHLKDIKEFNAIKNRFLDFVHGEPSEADRYYDWDSFGFSINSEPSDDELIEWLGNIFIDKSDADNIDPHEWFAIPEF